LRVSYREEVNIPMTLDAYAGREKSNQSGQKRPGPHATKNKD
jgi:hypothetical protein